MLVEPAFRKDFQPFNLCGTNLLSQSGFDSLATFIQDFPMTAATMYMNMQGPFAPNMDGECNTPEIVENISNIMMLENNGLNGSYTQTPNISQYWFPDQQEAPNYAPSPAAPYSGQESSLPAFCGPMVASSPPIPPCSLSPPLDSPPILNSVKDGFHQLVKEELKWTIRARRLNNGLQASPTETASLTTREEVGRWAGQCTTNNTNMHQSLNNNNNNNNNTDNNYNYSYNSCLQSHGSPDGYCYFSPGSTLTPEDEDRRKRRRERNKIAATKCRNKKKEKTANLVQESVHLEATNVSLNKEIRQLQAEIQRLKSVLENHRCTFPVQQNSHFMPMPIIYNTSCSAL